MSSPRGIQIFAEGVNPVVDIVAIHGIGGHREESWTVNGVNWLRDLLPSEIPHTRIFSWGYNDNDSEIQPHHLLGHAPTLLSDLQRERKLTETEKRPIIFIAHNLGGLILKEALIRSPLTQNTSSIQLSTYGIFFMGTPHQDDGRVRLGELIPKAVTLFKNSAWLPVQLGQYAPISGNFATKLYYETHPTKISTWKRIMVVPRNSAAPLVWEDMEGLPMHTDHVNIVRFASKDAGGYREMSENLWVMADMAPGVISARWGDHD